MQVIVMTYAIIIIIAVNTGTESFMASQIMTPYKLLFLNGMLFLLSFFFPSSLGGIYKLRHTLRGAEGVDEV